jgi:hypothetical protein
VPTLSIAFHCQPSCLSFDHQIDSPATDWPLRMNAVTSINETLQHLFFEWRVYLSVVHFDRPEERLRIPSMFDKASP